MPELPEVETLCRQLNTVLPGKRIRNVEILDNRLEKVDGLVGRQVESVYRRGKSIMIAMGRSGRCCASSRPARQPVGRAQKSPKPTPAQDDGLTVSIHLRMTGRLLWCTDDALLFPYTRLVLSFTAGRLILIDPRRFATFALQTLGAAPALLANPLEGLPAKRLQEIAASRRLPVKSFLMDQRFIAGIGNIYACEILHHAGLDPQRPAGSLKAAEWRKVEKASDEVLLRAVTCRGTTVSDWRDLFGMGGTNQDHLLVYSREGDLCPRCGGRIERIKMSGRGTWFCPSCQK